ncbi:hypothetical protein RA28_10780 [Ruegeria sp. ANG-S4]|uniref:hypothetical protein n=1 Tax=Ruegeria sp. ANG-S4 TaxID=1577904 RepID=UPI00057DB628|nr:hypothetical protein [Ruegeria sp. ANG-S4]KIC44983.1 hypothetical protein RA28_10780 [Ruegeria sp. ANG-S4]
MSVKNRVKKLEIRSSDRFKVICPTVSFLDENGTVLERSNEFVRREQLDELARSALFSVSGMETRNVVREEGESLSGFKSRITDATREMYAASDKKGIWVYWGAKRL